MLFILNLFFYAIVDTLEYIRKLYKGSYSMWLILLMNALFALSFTIAKGVLDYGKPLFFVGVRMVVAGIILISFIRWAKGKEALRIARKDWGMLALLTLTHIYLTYVLDLLALQHMSSFKGAFLYNLSPFITAFFSYCYFSEIMTPKKWIGLCIGFSGFLPEIIVNYSNPSNGSVPLVSRAEIMMIGSVVAASLGWVILRNLVKKNYTPFVLNGIVMFVGGLASLLTSALYERWDLESPVYAFKPFFGLTILIIVVSNLILYNMYGFLLRKYTATFISFTGFVIPIFAALFGWLFLHEAVSWHFAFSVLVVSVGLWLFYSEDLRQGYVIKK